MKFLHLHEARNSLEEWKRRLLQAYALYGKERLRQRKQRVGGVGAQAARTEASLGGKLPLFTELPRRTLLGNWEARAGGQNPCLLLRFGI